MGSLHRALLTVSSLDNDINTDISADVTMDNLTNADFLFSAAPERLPSAPHDAKNWRYLREPALRRRYAGVLRALSECASLEALLEYAMAAEVDEEAVLEGKERETLLLLSDLVNGRIFF